MKGNTQAADGFPLLTHWADQFMNESEHSIKNEEVRAIAQTVLFYAGLLLESAYPSNALTPSSKEAATDWLLAAEEDIVHATMRLVPPNFHRLLQLSLRTVRHNGINVLTANEQSELRTQAVTFIRGIRHRLDCLADTWFQ